MSAIIATNAIIKNDRDQQTAMERLSTGLRINSAGDDAAGLAISQRMQAEVSGLNMSVRNANDAISMLETIEGSSQEIASALQRMRELAVQAASDTMGVTDRAALDLEFGQLFQEMERIALNTTWNEMTILNGQGATPVRTAAVVAETFTMQLGKAAGQSMAVRVKSFDPRSAIRAAAQMEIRDGITNAVVDAGNVWGAAATYAAPGGGTDLAAVANSRGLDRTGNDEHHASALANTDTRPREDQAYGSAVLWTGDVGRAVGAVTPQRINIQTLFNASYSLVQLDKAISAVSAERARMGAFINRLDHAADNLMNVSRHQEQSRSRIADADYAVETTELSRTTIIAQASTAMLAQANAAKQTVLTLLQ
jgi:flagellin